MRAPFLPQSPDWLTAQWAVAEEREQPQSQSSFAQQEAALRADSKASAEAEPPWAAPPEAELRAPIQQPGPEYSRASEEALLRQVAPQEVELLVPPEL
jgi:hypothetical protein